MNIDGMFMDFAKKLIEYCDYVGLNRLGFILVWFWASAILRIWLFLPTPFLVGLWLGVVINGSIDTMVLVVRLKKSDDVLPKHFCYQPMLRMILLLGFMLNDLMIFITHHASIVSYAALMLNYAFGDYLLANFHRGRGKRLKDVLQARRAAKKIVPSPVPVPN